MSRTNLSAGLVDAITIDGSYYMSAKARLYLTRIFFDAITEDHAISGADAQGMIDDPMCQDIEYCANNDSLVTFFSDTGTLQYAIEGANTIYSTVYDVSPVKPGVLENSIFLREPGLLKTIHQYTIDWSLIATGDDDPFTSAGVYELDTAGSINAIHAVTADSAVIIVYDDGGFRPWLVESGETNKRCTYRFMFPYMVEPEIPDEGEEVPTPRTMEELAICSGAAKLGNKVFVYISNSILGIVEGCYFDYDNETWSDIFTVLPTDLQTSQCEFRISNVYEHDDVLYMCGLFHRIDNIDENELTPYSLLLRSTSGKTFEIGRPVLVSNLGYRFLARVGNGKLYLGNCNRVCKSDITWYFDGLTQANSRVVNILANDIKGFTDNSNTSATLLLRSGLEEYYTDAETMHGSKIVVELGMKVDPEGVGQPSELEYMDYGTYIIDNVSLGIGVGNRETSLSLTNEAMFNLSGLSMPFYAEILGKSIMRESMQKPEEGITNLSAAGNGTINIDRYNVDFWDHEGYTDDDITGINMHLNGGVDFYRAETFPHRLGIITSGEIKDVLGILENPIITDTTLNLHIAGWSHPATESGVHSDEIAAVLIMEDKYGNEYTMNPGYSGDHGDNLESGWWSFDWPYDSGGVNGHAVEVNITGLTIGDRIKKVGVVFDCQDNGTWFNIARIGFHTGSRIYYPLWGADGPMKIETTHWEVPHQGKPYVMLSAKPYDAYNFKVQVYGVAHLTTTYEDPTMDPIEYPVGFGAVGFAEDARNYIVARINVYSERFELVKVRDGVETVLEDEAITATHYWGVRLDYSGGLFRVYQFDVIHETYELILTYEWREEDGYLYTSTVASARCGLYGCIGTAISMINGFNETGNEETTTSEFIPFDCATLTSSWPSYGKARIGDDVYAYDAKIDIPAYPRGPYQYRAKYKYDSSYGIQCRDFEWGGYEPSDNLIGKVLAVDNGSNFTIAGFNWRVTGSYSRAEYRTYNDQAFAVFGSLANKVYITGGLHLLHKDDPNPRHISGPGANHSGGEIVTYERDASVVIYEYTAAGGSDDTTVGDMIDSICNLSGAKHSFPGDITIPNITLTPTETTIGVIPYAEGYDLGFIMPPESPVDITIKAEGAKIDWTKVFYGEYLGLDHDTDLVIRIVYEPDYIYKYQLLSSPSNTILDATRAILNNEPIQKVRILLLSDHVGIYQNGQWIANFGTAGIIYGSSLTVKMACASSSVNIDSVLLKDISDWREAIYIDLETDGRSALGSVIQQRPIEMVAKSDGSIDFWYEKTRDVVNARVPRDHRFSYSVPTDGASDAIVYGSKEVATVQNPDFAKELGFATKVMRMPDLGVGAIRASKKIMSKIYGQHKKHRITTRPDLRLEVGDIYHVDYTAHSSSHSQDVDVVVESTNLELRISGNKLASKMTVEGRERLSEEMSDLRF